MTNEEIRKEIDENNEQLKHCVHTGSFIFDLFAAELRTRNNKLRSLCTHKFENGKCIYCDMEEEYFKKVNKDNE